MAVHGTPKTTTARLQRDPTNSEKRVLSTRMETRQIIPLNGWNYGGTVVSSKGQNYWITAKLNQVLNDTTVE
jgi:hypothetical protein